jgi:hypothetical protein
MGKVEKFRDCPVAGRKIKRIECGQNRGKNYACPPDCPYCPWSIANYDDLLEIESAIDTATLKYYLSVVGDAAAKKNLKLDELDTSDDGELLFQSACYREFFQREIEPGMRLCDLWRADGWSGLTRDEPYLAGFKAKVRPTLLEVCRVIDDLQVACVDLLDPPAGEFIVCDRGLASGALQFQCFLGWLCAYPFFSRIHGTACPLPPGAEPRLDFFRRHVRELGGPEDGPLTGWLFEHFSELLKQITEESRNSLKAMFRNADIKECVAVYRLTAEPEDLMLDDREDFDETGADKASLIKHGNHRAYVWLRTGPSKPWESELPEAMRGGIGGPGTPIWGNLRVFSDRVEITAVSENHFRPMQKMVDAFFGDLLAFDKASVRDVAKQSWPGHESASTPEHQMHLSASYFPEEVEDTDAVMQHFFRSHYEKFLDDRVPALDDMTPREAAKRPDMRERLITLMKEHLQTMDGQSKNDGRRYDINWVLDELGLEELKVPARPITETFSKGWWEVLGEEEFAARLKAVASNPEAAWCLNDFPELADYVEGIDAALLNKTERESLMLLLDCAIATLIPADVVVEEIDAADLARETQDLFEQIFPEQPTVETLIECTETLFAISVQPAIVKFAASVFMSQTSTGKIATLLNRGKKVRAESILPMLAQVEAFLRCLRRLALN